MTCSAERRIDGSRLRKIEHLNANDWLYEFRVTSPNELDDTVRAWIRESYEVGHQEHLIG